MSDIDEDILDLAEPSAANDAGRPKTRKRKSGNATAASPANRSTKKRRVGLSRETIEDDDEETEDEYPQLDPSRLSPPNKGYADKGSGDDANGSGDEEEDEDDDEDADEMDLESEDGYSAPPHGIVAKEEKAAPAPSAASKRPPVPKRESSSTKKTAAATTKKATAAKEKAAGKAVGRAVKKAGGAVSAKAVAVAKNKVAASANIPYPLEGKYKDENDREYLLNLPEIEREQILADRADDRQKQLDSLALGELYKATRGPESDEEDEQEDGAHPPAAQAAGEDDDESEAMDLVDSDEDAEGEEDNSTEDLGQRRVAKPEHKNRAMAALNEKRKQRADRAERRQRGSVSPSRDRVKDMFSDEESDGPTERPTNGVKDRKSSRRDGYDDYSDDEEYSRSKRESRERHGDSSKARDRRGGESRSSKKEPLKATALNQARLSRADLAEYKHRTFFEAMLKGEPQVSPRQVSPLLIPLASCSDSYVKCPFGRDERGQTKYRCYLVLGLTPEGSTYEVEHKGKTFPENRKLTVQYGRAKQAIRMSDVSNQPFDDKEVFRWWSTMNADDQDLPSASDLESKAQSLQKQRESLVTDAEIRARIDAFKRLGRLGQTSERERSRLESERSLAERRGDLEAVRALDEQLRELALNITAQRRQSQDGKEQDDLAIKLAVVNEKNRKAALANSRRAHQAELNKRKQIDDGTIYDASARVKTKRKQHDATMPKSLAVLQSEAAATAQNVVADLTAENKAAAEAAAKAAVLNTKSGALAVDLDLGDF
ncbi:hypothetical protein QFC21_000657 [Naganishia friedmannii]|uniref:Uncharacterized protein n=1 Tax=Naganishia friedmannii TaxID=89922 RepID=A0ACC2WC54_9TREE|nr:hypothetical protein QFC21_000657 [Naganishia friedmannii]